MSSRSFSQTVVTLQARLQALEIRLENADRFDHASDFLDKFSEGLDELLQLSRSYSQAWQKEQELSQRRSKALQTLSNEANESCLLILNAANFLQSPDANLSSTSKEVYLQLIRSSSHLDFIH